MQDLRLELVSPANSVDLSALAREYSEAGEEGKSQGFEDLSAFLTRVENFALGRNLPPDRVPSSEYWLFRGSRILGNSRLRTKLIPKIELDGGHISYDIRPSERRRGNGTELLRLTLIEARRAGLDAVLLTTDNSNTGSIRVMERNGGKLLDETVSPFSGETLLRFSIQLGAGSQA